MGPHLEAAVEGHVNLGDRAQPAVDVGVGTDHLDLEPGYAAVADLLDRVGHAVHPSEAVGDDRDTWPVAVVACQLELLAPQEGGRSGVWDRRHACVEELGGGATGVREPALLDDGHGVLDDRASSRSWIRRARR